MDFFQTYPWLLAILIFCARICDVSLGTIRTIIVFRGYRFLAALIGFFEVSIWVLAAGKVLTNLNEWYLILAYASGYATGNIVGIWFEGKLAVGNAIVRIFSPNPHTPLGRILRDQEFFVTEVAGFGLDEKPVDVVFVVAKRKDVPKLIRLTKETDPTALYTVEDIRSVHEGIYQKKTPGTTRWWNIGVKRH